MTDDIKMPCEIALEADAELMKLFEEIDNERGQDSAFMDDMFGGWLTLTVPILNIHLLLRIAAASLQLPKWHTK